MSIKIVWTIAGSDASGGAGLQADLHTFQQLDVHGCAVITAVTAQNIEAVNEIFYLPGEQISAQITALAAVHHPLAVKIGMLGSIACIDAVADFLKNYNGYVILDPVFAASSGRQLFTDELDFYLHRLQSIYEFVDVLTPNLLEAETLLARKIVNDDDIAKAANDLLHLGVSSVLIKGGHMDGALCRDYWTNGVESCWLSSPRIEQVNCHGTGCVLSSALTAALASGEDIKDALVLAKMFVNRGIRLSQCVSLSAFFQYVHGWSEDAIDLPYVYSAGDGIVQTEFAREDIPVIGFYPIVDNAHLLNTLLASGVECIQLRIKDLTGEKLNAEIAASVALVRQYGARLYINDYWREAIANGAYGVHLGQEDLSTADLAAIYRAGLRLGISTHSYYELARAHAYHPSYIAFGPVFATTSKLMSFTPQGVKKLKKWRRLVSAPLVAIGGINETNIVDVMATGVDGVAMISAVSATDHPGLAARNFVKMIGAYAA